MSPPDQAIWFTESVRPHEAALRVFLSRRFSSLPDDDLVQETSVRLLRGADPQRLVHARAFLFTTARNIAIDHVRRTRRTPVDSLDDIAEIALIGSGAGQTVPQNIGANNTPWGRNDDLFPGGWTGQTMRENWISNVRNGNSGIPVLEAYNGRPNEFTRDNRLNLNAMYRFSEGALRGSRVGVGYRWRAPAAIGFGVKRINGVAVPDVSIIQKGKAETAVDFSFGYNGKSAWLGNRRYSLGVNIRNAFPPGRYDTRNRDFLNGNSLTTVRLIPRQFIFSYETDL